jgi:CMP-N-acetylneuraminic acid synthetase
VNFFIAIPARKNSKRLKNKNILKINNKELIKYSIEIAVKIKNSNVVVISDSKKIIKISKKYKNVDASYKRPKKFSEDKTSMFQTINDAVNWFEKKNKQNIDHIILLQPTSPNRNLKQIREIINFYTRNNLSSLTTISPINVNNNSILNKTKCGYVFLKNKRPLYKIDGNLYICRKNFLKKYKNFSIEKKTFFFLNKNQFTLDIDTKEDFLLAKTIMEANDKK